MKQVGGNHYEKCSLQPWEVIRRNGLNFWEGNVVKYLLRHQDKNGKEDLLKAQHYLTYLVENYEQLFRSEYVSNQSQERQSSLVSPRDLSDLWRGANGTSYLPSETLGSVIPSESASPNLPR